MLRLKEYAGAIDHYLSSERRDRVKVEWEEPFSEGLCGDVIAAIGPRPTLRVLDVGCGTGDGLALLSRLSQKHPRLVTALEYVGLDVDDDMVDTARAVHAGRDDAEFIRGDVREGVPTDPFDVYLSCGVPYSHLTTDELNSALVQIFSTIRRNRTYSAVVIDVLGRYSLEWVRNWEASRWPYRMSFFESDKAASPTQMSFYCSDELGSVVDRAAAKAGCEVTGSAFYDRSVTVGRHTTTGEFNESLPPYRTLVNKLLDPDEVLDPCELLFYPELGPAPARVLRFFEHFSSAWNALVLDALGRRQQSIGNRARRRRGLGRQATAVDFGVIAEPTDFEAWVSGPALARELQHLEASMQGGLGAAHSLTAVVLVDGRGAS